jgi:hypothetical protein
MLFDRVTGNQLSFEAGRRYGGIDRHRVNERLPEQQSLKMCA